MPHYTCDACHTIFEADNVPELCPFCNNSAIFVKNSAGRQFKLAAVRPSTDHEIEQCKIADEKERKKQSFTERIKSLSCYKLSDDEYHTALMLLFYLKDAPSHFAQIQLGNLLNPRNSFSENKVAETMARELYYDIQKHFSRSLGDERRKTGCNDAVEVASYAGDESAASLLVQFRQSDIDQIFCKTPNLTNIRNVRFDKIIKEPGEGYMQFLMDWYNSVG